MCPCRVAASLLAYFCKGTANGHNFLNKNFDQGVNVIKRFTAVRYDFSYLARAFVPGKPFQPSLTFVGKARGLP